MCLQDIPTVTDMAAYEEAVETFRRGGSRLAYLEKLFFLGTPASDIRFLANCRSRTMMMRER